MNSNKPKLSESFNEQLTPLNFDDKAFTKRLDTSPQNQYAKKIKFKHDSYRQQTGASVNESMSESSNFITGQMNQAPAGLESPEVQIDETVFSNKESKAYKSLKKIKQSRIEQNKIKDVQEKAFQFVENRDKVGLMRLLDQNKSIPVVDLVDIKGYTLMHMICFKNLEDMGLHLIDLVKETVVEKQIKIWINLKTVEDGFTALHFASFRGNITLIKMLLQTGADINAVNNYGINVMHVAAQGDQPISLYFFKQKGLDLQSTDNRQSTPLHWACYSRSEIALCYLLSWVEDLDRQDVEGFTALHLAIKSSEVLRSVRPVRSLLIRGASRNARDNKGNRPIDILDEVTTPYLQQELRSMLKEPKVCSCLMIKTPLMKMKRSFSTPLFFLFLLIINYFLLILFIIPYMENHLWWFIANSLINFVTLMLFIGASFKDPGYLKKPKDIDFLVNLIDSQFIFQDMLQNFDPVLLCPDCEVIRTSRSRHCSICNQCIERFDHHCPWINNCVGINNHYLFMLFLTSVSLLMTTVITTVSYCISTYNEELIHTDYVLDILPIEVHQQPTFLIAAIINLITSCFFIIPVLFLAVIQMRNFCINKTTNERFARRASTSSSETTSRASSMLSVSLSVDEQLAKRLEDSQRRCSCLYNCFQMCCNHKIADQHNLYENQLKETLREQQQSIKIVRSKEESDIIEEQDELSSKGGSQADKKYKHKINESSTSSS